MYFLHNIKTDKPLEVKKISKRTHLSSENMKSKESIIPYNLFYFEGEKIQKHNFVPAKHFLFLPKTTAGFEGEVSSNQFLIKKKKKAKIDEPKKPSKNVEIYSQVLPPLNTESLTNEGYFDVKKMISKKLYKSIDKYDCLEAKNINEKILHFFKEADKKNFLNEEIKNEFGLRSRLNDDRIKVMIVIFTLMRNNWSCKLEKFSGIRKLQEYCNLLGCKIIDGRVKLVSKPKYKIIKKK
ncbi:hypothetical protein H312_01276 [Anncaliia algerae PRA339]|uniref:Uncharacterized protein n=1 Tax=Anncaliia algerae PRA339 TaxID=1288291 RepID=A0A059F254_9MICR|nr:hypothetical protein H312_01276 [Anncaliia algerae PRA339]